VGTQVQTQSITNVRRHRHGGLVSYLAYEASRAQGITVPALLDDYIKDILKLEVVDTNDPKVDAVVTAMG
jgi:hypothetical protein